MSGKIKSAVEFLISGSAVATVGFLIAFAIAQAEATPAQRSRIKPTPHSALADLERYLEDEKREREALARRVKSLEHKVDCLRN